MEPAPLPTPICSIIGDVLGGYYYNHSALDGLFYTSGAQGSPPEGSCVKKCQRWLSRLHEEVEDPLAVLGRIIAEFMDVDRGTGDAVHEEPGRTKIREVLQRQGLSYQKGGRILGATNTLATKSLEEILRERDLVAVNKEFNRSLEHIESDPPASITAASAILESLFKIYIEDAEIEMPGEQSLQPLWKTAGKHLGLDPAKVEDMDLKKIFSGLNSVLDGIGSLRTHVETAHGRGSSPHNVRPAHARLAIHAAHTLVVFFLETWDERKKATAPA